MLSADVVVAGGGIAGLLIASALAAEASVVLVEQEDELPRNKYWLSDEGAALANPDLQECVDRRYNRLDFVAYDGLRASLSGAYCLWHTDRLIDTLHNQFLRMGGQMLTGHRIYSICREPNEIRIRANSEVMSAKLLVDCMGFGSPLVGAKGVASILGYYVMYGREVRTRSGQIIPVALDNILVHKRPAYFEMFPTSNQTAHAAVILPTSRFKPDRSIKDDLDFILSKSHYADLFIDPQVPSRSYFGIIPVGRLRKAALDRIIFFGEAGQTNPAASATGLSRMLHNYRALASSVVHCIRHNTTSERDLADSMPQHMTRMNRIFQECVFESLLSFDSDDFRKLVLDLQSTPDAILNDLIFAQFDFGMRRTLPIALRTLLRPHSVLGPHILRSIQRFCTFH